MPSANTIVIARADKFGLAQLPQLRSGFYLAMHGLEIRGAGEVLGENQSGNMMEVSLYSIQRPQAGQDADLPDPQHGTAGVDDLCVLLFLK